jgi:hypothetical protein
MLTPAAPIASALVLLAACTTQLMPDAEHVVVANNANDVRGCQSLQLIQAEPPFTTSKDAINVMKNQVAMLGGNTLFVTNYSLKATGVAYKCPRQ